MTITLTCPCGKRLQTAETFAGREARCPACGRMLRVPDGGPPEAFPNLSLDAPARPLPHPEPPAAVDLDVTRQEAADVSEPNPLDFSAPPGGFLPHFRLHSPLSVAGAALLGGALGGCVLLSMNFRALRRPVMSVTAVLLGVVSVVAGMVAAQVVPPLREAPLFSSLAVFVPLMSVLVVVNTGSPLAAGLLLLPPLAVGGGALLAQGPAFRAHVSKGGRTHGGRRSLATGLVCAACGVGVILAAYLPYVGFITEKSSDGYISYGSGQEVFYRKGTSAEEAHRLATALQDLGYFQGMGPATVALSRSGDTYVVSFCVRDHVWEDEESIAMFEELRKELGSRAFADQAVEVRLCDGLMRVKRTIK